MNRDWALNVRERAFAGFMADFHFNLGIGGNSGVAVFYIFDG
jgi:hypothetical protein